MIKVTDLTDEGHVEARAAHRVNAEPANRAEILRTAEIFQARVVDVTHNRSRSSWRPPGTRQLEALIEAAASRPIRIDADGNGRQQRAARRGTRAPRRRHRGGQQPRVARTRRWSATADWAPPLTRRKARGCPPEIYYDQDADLGLEGGRWRSSAMAAGATLLNETASGLGPGRRRQDSRLRKSWAKETEKEGLEVATVNAPLAAQMADHDHCPTRASATCSRPHEIKGGLGKGKMVMFAHGFNIHFNQVVPPPEVDVHMIAPKAPGHVIATSSRRGPGVPALLAVYQDVSGQGSRPRPRVRQGRGLHPRGRDRDDLQRKRRRPTCSANRRRSAAASRI